ncbi:MAG: hypothetical protein QGI78_07575 [Phycisphaerales bacterium]|nr:hypothetical protein [Phycisphaerales bacterium]
MDYRRFAIRVLYVSLAIAACTGVAAVFIPTGSKILWRLLATAIATGFSAAWLLGGVRSLENPRTRSLGYTIGILVCVQLPLIYTNIWLDFLPIRSNSFSNNLSLSTLILFLCGVPLMVGAYVLGHRFARRSGILLMCCWILLALIWVTGIWTKSIGKGMYLDTIAEPLAWCSPIGAILLLKQPVRWTGLVLLVSTCVLWQWIGFRHGYDWSNYPNALAWLLSLALVPSILALATLLTITKPQFRFNRYEFGATVLGGIAIATSFATVWCTVTGKDYPLLVQFTVATLILGGTSTIGVFITQSLKATMLIAQGDVSLETHCPRCRVKIELHQGKNTCPHCKLRFKLLCESPNCSVCAYDLTDSTRDRCPECGHSITSNPLQ